MKNLLLTISGLLIMFSCRAQVLYLDGGFEFLQVSQEGVLYVQDTSANSLFYSARSVLRHMAHYGIMVQGFYPLRREDPRHEMFATGPVFGIAISNGRKKLSYDPQYQPKRDKFFNNGTGNIRIPLMWSIRSGNMIEPELSDYGIEFSAGVQTMHINTADEAGWCIIPSIRGGFQYKHFGFAINYFVMKYTSYYNVNGEEFVRLTNTLLSFNIQYSFGFFVGKVE